MNDKLKIEIIKLLEERYPDGIFSLDGIVYNPITFAPRTGILNKGVPFGSVEIEGGSITFFIKK